MNLPGQGREAETGGQAILLQACMERRSGPFLCARAWASVVRPLLLVQQGPRGHRPGPTCLKDTAPWPGLPNRSVLPRAWASHGLMSPPYPESELCHLHLRRLKPTVVSLCPTPTWVPDTPSQPSPPQLAAPPSPQTHSLDPAEPTLKKLSSYPNLCLPCAHPVLPPVPTLIGKACFSPTSPLCEVKMAFLF